MAFEAEMGLTTTGIPSLCAECPPLDVPDCLREYSSMGDSLNVGMTKCKTCKHLEKMDNHLIFRALKQANSANVHRVHQYIGIYMLHEAGKLNPSLCCLLHRAKAGMVSGAWS